MMPGTKLKENSILARRKCLFCERKAGNFSPRAANRHPFGRHCVLAWRALTHVRSFQFRLFLEILFATQHRYWPIRCINCERLLQEFVRAQTQPGHLSLIKRRAQSRTMGTSGDASHTVFSLTLLKLRCQVPASLLWARRHRHSTLELLEADRCSLHRLRKQIRLGSLTFLKCRTLHVLGFEGMETKLMA